MAKRKKTVQRRPRGPEQRKLSEAAATLMRSFNEDLDAMARSYNEIRARLQIRYARQIAKIDRVDVDAGWALDARSMSWVQVPQQGGTG